MHFNVSQMLLSLYLGSINLHSICLNLIQVDLRKWDEGFKSVFFFNLTFHDIMKSIQSSTNIC